MFVSTSSNKSNVSDLKLEIKIQITGGFYNFYPVYGVDLFSPNIGVWTPLNLSSSSSQSTLESRYNTCFIQFYHDYNHHAIAPCYVHLADVAIAHCSLPT